ncbi:SGNH/GDSL hydrolase family protein [Acuticoccus sediminis]|uniref:SGNH/GDSL hydrolase family protein n=1 Tax=Acuticoccus sediminis TaxID=2184697 RepID=UPI001CFCBEF3|nr:SGNH/GDSL hydrolase family protein [Acuticoccus sediminis]
MAPALTFDTIYFFGGSLTDSGNFYAATEAVSRKAVPLTSAGYAEQFSNGPVYADLVPGLLGVAGGEETNYAVGGARILADRTIEDVIGRFAVRPDATEEDLAYGVDYPSEIERFVADHGGEDLSNVAISIFVGSNDLREFRPPRGTLEAKLAAAHDFGVALADAMLEETAPAIDLGVGTVIFNTLPDSGVFPVTRYERPNDSLISDAVVAAYNETLASIAEDLEDMGTTAVVVHLDVLFEEVTGDAASFNFRDPGISVYLGGGNAPIPNFGARNIPQDQLIFFDLVHPTTEMHEIIAAFEAASLTANVVIGDALASDVTGTMQSDLFLGRDGDDTAELGLGDDIAIGGLGNDSLVGGPGENLLMGGAGDDTVTGGGDDDILADGTGDDGLAGGGGNDLLIVGAGSDTARGGAGDDVVVWTEPSLVGGDRRGGDQTVLCGGEGTDTLVLRVADAGDATFDDPTAVNVFEALGVTAGQFEEIIVVEGFEELPISSDQIATADLWHLI